MFKVNNKDTERRYFTPYFSVYLLSTLNRSMPAGKMLMVSKVQEEFHHFFASIVKKG